MQRDVCLAKFEYYPDVHDKKKRYDFGVLLGHCAPVSEIPETCFLVEIAFVLLQVA